MFRTRVRLEYGREKRREKKTHFLFSSSIGDDVFSLPPFFLPELNCRWRRSVIKTKSNGSPRFFLFLPLRKNWRLHFLERTPGPVFYAEKLVNRSPSHFSRRSTRLVRSLQRRLWSCWNLNSRMHERRRGRRQEAVLHTFKYNVHD